MEKKPDYILPISNGLNINEIKTFLKSPKQVSIPDKPLSKNQVAQLLTHSLLNDLFSKGYGLSLQKIGVNEHQIDVFYPDYSALSSNIKKEFVQKSHQLERDNQLNKKSNIAFIKRLETMKLHKNKWVSIFNLMADGKVLGTRLEKNNFCVEEEIDDYKKIIDPYIEFVEPKKKCSQTGLILNDIWRYFRHTWSLEYKSLPGRSIRILIRDKSMDNHPIIGIAALGSSVAQQTVRDEMLGWSQNKLKGDIEIDKKWYTNSYNRLISSVKQSDLLNRNFKIISKDLYKSITVRIDKKEIQAPIKDTINKLELLNRHFMDLHYSGKNKPKKAKGEDFHSNKYWNNQSKLPLFIAKRCRALKIILEIHIKVKKSDTSTDLLIIPAVLYKKLLRIIKAEKVGIDLMDIIICGAIAPYNHMLGGKLIAMLLASPEVTQFVRKKYLKAPSIIASSIKGKPFYRIPNLVFLGTTSLYGKGLSQYTRLSIPSNVFDESKKSSKSVKYKSLGETLGYGTYHISTTTIQLARLFNERINPEDDIRAPRVNYIFGEGINPLFRMLNQAITKLGFPAAHVLKHQSYRAVYANSLIENIEDYLIGKENKPKYIIPQNFPKRRTKQIVNYWANRWLTKRIGRQDIIELIKSNSLEYPISHGARVPLKVQNYGPLFE